MGRAVREVQGPWRAAPLTASQAPPRGRLLPHRARRRRASSPLDQLTKAWAVADARRRSDRTSSATPSSSRSSRNPGERVRSLPGHDDAARGRRDRRVGPDRARGAATRPTACALDRLRARARRRARQPLRPLLPLAGLPPRPRRRLRRGRPVPGVQRRRLVHHDRRDHPRVAARCARHRREPSARGSRERAEPIDGPARARRRARRPRRRAAHRLEPRRRAGAARSAASVLVDGHAVGKSHRLRAGEVVELLAEPAPARRRSAEPDVDGRRPLRRRRRRRRRQAGRARRASRRRARARHARARPARALSRDRDGRRPVPARHRAPPRPRHERAHGRRALARARTTRSSSSCRARAVERRYIALVWGHLDVAARHRSTRRSAARRRDARAWRCATTGRPARTGYEVRPRVRRRRVCSLLECTLETGRTHQIRVHLAAIGHPVVGDATYGGRRDSIALSRPFLHATHARVRASGHRRASMHVRRAAARRADRGARLARGAVEPRTSVRGRRRRGDRPCVRSTSSASVTCSR